MAYSPVVGSIVESFANCFFGLAAVTTHKLKEKFSIPIGLMSSFLGLAFKNLVGLLCGTFFLMSYGEFAIFTTHTEYIEFAPHDLFLGLSPTILAKSS